MSTENGFEHKAEAHEIPKHLDVSELMKEKNCYFVHTIQIDNELDVSENNKAVDATKLSLQDKLDILYSASPALSVSTIRPHTMDGTFRGGYGVVFSQGEVVSAHPGDTGSRAVSLNERTLIGQEYKNDKDDIDRAVDRASGGSRSYNELILKAPEIAGGFLKIEGLMDHITNEQTVADYGSGGGEVSDVVGVLKLENITDARGGMLKNFDTVVRTLQEMKFYGPVFLMDGDNQLHQVIDIDDAGRTVTFSAKSLTPPDFAEVYAEQRMDTQTKEALRGRLTRRGVLS